MRTLRDRLWSRTDRSNPNGCWNWQGYRSPTGHGQIQGGLPDRKVIGTHRAAWIVSNGDIPEGMSVCHHCDNPACCNPAHLFLGTQADNNRDCYNKRRSVHFVARHSWPVGENSPRAKISDKAAAEIMAEISRGTPRRKMAERWGITVSAISKMVNGKSRKYLTQQPA